MWYALMLGLGVVIGGTGVWFLLKPQIAYFRDEMVTAQDRLFGAWSEGKVIPPREAVTDPVPEVPLPDWAYAVIGDFDSVQGKQKAEGYIREKITAGWTKQKILEGMFGIEG